MIITGGTVVFAAIGDVFIFLFQSLLPRITACKSSVSKIRMRRRKPDASSLFFWLQGIVERSRIARAYFEIIRPENSVNPMKLRETAQGTLIEVYVKPRSEQFKIEAEEDELLVFCRESPVKGRVNGELIKELSRLFKRRVRILSGFRSRQKTLLIENATTQEVSEILSHARTRKET